MRQTLFLIPDALFGLPLFGWGLLLFLWLALSVGWQAWQVRRRGWHDDDYGQFFMIAVLAVVIVAVLPQMVVRESSGSGVPIRGFGAMVLMGIVGGLGLGAHLAKKAGLNPEVLFSLATWLIVGGVLGARAFYVIEYWPQFAREDLLSTAKAVLSVAAGGIVLYGGLIGGAVGFLMFARIHKLPALALADLVAPTLALGYACGRIGCFMNGCCFGGACELPWAVSFPQGSPPYESQIQHGKLAPPWGGLVLDRTPSGQPKVERVRPDSPAAKAGILPGDLLASIAGRPLRSLEQAMLLLDQAEGKTVSIQVEGSLPRELQLIGRPPSASKPIHPTQLYSSINGFILCWLLATILAARLRDGIAVGAMLTLYPISRFVIEAIRIDEDGVFGTPLSISQVVSLLMLAGVSFYWFWLLRRPPERRSWPDAVRWNPAPEAG